MKVRVGGENWEEQTGIPQRGPGQPLCRGAGTGTELSLGTVTSAAPEGGGWTTSAWRVWPPRCRGSPPRAKTLLGGRGGGTSVRLAALEGIFPLLCTSCTPANSVALPHHLFSRCSSPGWGLGKWRFFLPILPFPRGPSRRRQRLRTRA